ncbi:hypothetical protein HYC85_018301 [Camellia sinensis]|uniref:Uncharacterized protein n=1 Tax=Camellia sinensis TaxID=4442 RepID=A0A7J7GXM5_CAMSI|nr:hypothetical protein HYC85_018301 [Camellia sinensis]
MEYFALDNQAEDATCLNKCTYGAAGTCFLSLNLNKCTCGNKFVSKAAITLVESSLRKLVTAAVVSYGKFKWWRQQSTLITRPLEVLPLQLIVLPNNKPNKPQLVPPTKNGPEIKTQLQKIVLKPQMTSETAIRPLKLIYDHDIRLAQMPVTYNFKVLREIVKTLSIFKDNDGDWVTIMCSSELRLAESCVDSLIPNDPKTDKIDSIGMLRLHIVEVSLEQERIYWKRRMRDLLRVRGSKEMRLAHNLLWVSLLLKLWMLRLIIQKRKLQIQRKKTRASEDPECKEVEMDDCRHTLFSGD